ncbi:hypothetical protein SESBI_21277 [Sesbania bispinosa]|nr:hypothetical protein SESBI_21277 [Sesbania bispinosa]
MAGNNMLALAEKRAKREAAKRAAVDAERAVAAGAGSSALTSSKAVTQVPGERPLKKVRTEALKGPLSSGKGVGSSASHSALQTPSGVPSSQRISWATPDPEEDAAMKLLGQQDEVAALPQIKRDFEAVSKKLKDDEVVMQDALKKMAEDLEGAREEWRVKAAEYEKEIQRVEDLWDESAEVFFHNAIDQIKFLNPGVDLRTRGMSTLCVVRDGKWYRGTGKFFVEEDPSEVEIAPPPMHPLILEADIASGDMKGPSESEMVDA